MSEVHVIKDLAAKIADLQAKLADAEKAVGQANKERDFFQRKMEVASKLSETGAIYQLQKERDEALEKLAAAEANLNKLSWGLIERHVSALESQVQQQREQLEAAEADCAKWERDCNGWFRNSKFFQAKLEVLEKALLQSHANIMTSSVIHKVEPCPICSRNQTVAIDALNATPEAVEQHRQAARERVVRECIEAVRKACVSCDGMGRVCTFESGLDWAPCVVCETSIEPLEALLAPVKTETNRC